MLGLQKIRRLAAQKGYSVDGAQKGRDGLERVIILDAKGRTVASPDRTGFNLNQAERLLTSLPDIDTAAAAARPAFGKRGLSQDRRAN